jgi:hypothetical protein
VELETSPPRVSLACLIRLEMVSLELFMGASNLTAKKGAKLPRLVERDPRKSLAEMRLVGICVGARMKTDSTIQAHIRLEDCVINDSRFERRASKGIMEIFHRKVS